MGPPRILPDVDDRSPEVIGTQSVVKVTSNDEATKAKKLAVR